MSIFLTNIYSMQYVHDIKKAYCIALHLLCNTFYRNNGRCPDLKGKLIHISLMQRMPPSGLIALLEIRQKFMSSMESLAHHEIGFNLIVFAILAFL